ncbi:DUF2834 domain-containing protein [Candidatus Gracilibacteria bacterium]|nr:DUF2834 domain-containing protein [Candidatus Gracilibacteria bacterium]MCF7898944.1 DUF2834 domain-containing protein [Candidatus Paceibacterota bacterium]
MIFIEFILGAIVTLVVAGCYIIAIAFTVWMMIDAGKQDRFWWLVLIIGVPVIGPAVYYFTEKKHGYYKAPVHHIHNSETEEQHEKSPKKKSVRKSKIITESDEESKGEIKHEEEKVTPNTDEVKEVSKT